MSKDKYFKKYNQLNQLFDITVMSIKEVLNDPKIQDNKCLVLMDKTDVVPTHKRKKHKKSKLDLIIERLDNIEKRLDKHDEMFRQHGWIK